MSTETKPETVAPKDIMVDYVLRIFEIYTFPRCIELMGEHCTAVCGALLRYIAGVPTFFSRAEKVAIVICQHNLFFKYFLYENCIFRWMRILQRPHDENDCTRCFDLASLEHRLLQKLATVAESGFGSGELARALVGDSTSDTSKEQAALMVGFIVRQPNTLFNLLFHCQALDKLFDVMEIHAQESSKTEIVTPEAALECRPSETRDIHGERFKTAVHSLKEIGKTCNFLLDEVSEVKEHSQDVACRDSRAQILNGAEEGVTIKLDSGISLLANKQLLVRII